MKKVLVKKNSSTSEASFMTVKEMVRLYDTKEGGTNKRCFGC